MLPSARRPVSPARVLAVTGGLVVAGGVVGGLVGLGVFSVFAAFVEVFGPGDGNAPLPAFLFAASAGATIGAITGPPLAWLLLRRVAIGKAILHTAVGSVIGGLIGGTILFLGLGGRSTFLLFLGSVFAGYVGAALRLWWRTRGKKLEARG